jgi:hypothetical protein
MDKLTDGPTNWVTISEAAPRLGLTPFGVRSRIRRGTLRTKPGNDGRRFVGIPADHLAGCSLSNSTGNSKDHSADHLNEHEAATEVEHWRTAAETARVAAAKAEGECIALRAQVTDLKGERDRLAAELALARKGWLERLIEAVRKR